MLTAALQNIVPREKLLKDPDASVLAWIDYAKDLGLDSIQLAAALPPELSNISAEQLLDPVADHLQLPLDGRRADKIRQALSKADLEIDSLGYFDDHLIDDPVQRKIKFDHMVKVMDAAVTLEVKHICGFVGRRQSLDMQQNLRAFEEDFIPLLREADSRDLTFLVEHCPMPGWNPSDTVINNIAYCPEMWVRLNNICVNYDLGDRFSITFDPSHCILMGQNPVTVIRQLRTCNCQDLLGGLHVKGQVIDPTTIDLWGYWGQSVDRGDHDKEGNISQSPADLGNAWKVMPCEHELPGTAYHDPLGYIERRTVDWFGLFYELRMAELDTTTIPLVIEHEYPLARVQEQGALLPILAGSIDFVRHIDAAAEAMYQLHNTVLPAQHIPIQGRLAYDHD